VSGLQSAFPLIAAWLAVPLFFLVLFVVFVTIKYSPIVSRYFQHQPPFMPLRVSPSDVGETVDFTADDGLRLRGTYLPCRTSEQAGVIVYCHEYLSDRWSYRPYIDHLRDLGFDLFSFDFRNHGESETERGYGPMQWTTDREVRDLRAALETLRLRPDRDPAGFGLFGVSRGGTTSLVAAATEPDVWGVVTDGAFPTHGTMVPYIRRWCDLYIPNPILRSLLPSWFFNLVAWTGRRHTEHRLNCRFPSVEAAAARLAPRPWLMIHGESDSYISPEIAQVLFDRGKEFKELWLVKDAKHNRCRETDPAGYAMRIERFLERFAPRRPWLAQPGALRVASVTDGMADGFSSADISNNEVASPVAG
jgi:pimeloyl-ACP methyl ester carboxylesterase